MYYQSLAMSSMSARVLTIRFSLPSSPYFITNFSQSKLKNCILWNAVFPKHIKKFQNQNI